MSVGSYASTFRAVRSPTLLCGIVYTLKCAEVHFSSRPEKNGFHKGSAE